MKYFIFVVFLCVSFELPLFADENLSVPTQNIRRPSKREIEAAVDLLPPQYRKEAQKALLNAGKNGRELIKTIELLSPQEREGLAFLLVNMPRRDLVSLSSVLLFDNVHWAYKAREEVPWGEQIPDDIFFNDVLPYANLNERRENWRMVFYDHFMAVAKESGTIEKAVEAINKFAFELLEVSYHPTKRPKPDQSPFESMEAHYASCTGLSILLVDALRTAGIPARVAGIPLWKDKSGNHTWVEVWDNGWHHIGAAEPGPYDRAWFTKKASETDPSVPEHRIYAASFARTGLKFPLVWNRKIHYVFAQDVTARYQTPTPASSMK